MKLRIKLSRFLDEESLEVEWNGTDPRQLPLVYLYNGVHYSFIMYDTLIDGSCDIILAETKDAALPIDMFGNPFPVTDLATFFNLKKAPTGVCECGAKKTSFPDNHMTFCPLWSKP